MFTLPKRLQWAKYAAVVQIIFSVTLFLVAYLALVRDTPFFRGVGDAIADGSGRAVLDLQTLAHISGPLFMSVIISIVVMLALRYRTRFLGWAAYVLLAVQVFGAFAVGGVALFALIMLLCLTSREVAEYLGVVRPCLADKTAIQH